MIRNAPLLDDGTPMPTRYWLVGRADRSAVDRLESAGGVRAAEAAVDPARAGRGPRRLRGRAGRRHPAGWAGPGRRGGVGGTRTGVKCLHAHYAWYLAGGDDPVGRWVAARLRTAVRGDAASGAVAAIDCGTNSTRLLVAGPGRDAARPADADHPAGSGRRPGPAGWPPTPSSAPLAVLREYRGRHGRATASAGCA